LTKIFDMHLAITQAVLKRNYIYRRRYRYIDLTAGKGFTPDGCKGSPLIFLERVESDSFVFPYRADFIECEKKNLDELESTVQAETKKNGWRGRDVHYHPGEYQQVVPSLFGVRDTRELGLVFVDHSGDPPDFATLQFIAKQRPKMEILVYLSATNIKRLFQYTDKLLSDYMVEVGKAHWLIRKPVSWDNHEWTFLLGSGSSLFKDYKRIDFLQLESEQAQEFFPKLNLSTKQRQDSIQPPLL
jgi:three-Cys-motif partner protein